MIIQGESAQMTIEADDQQLSDIPDWRYLLREYYEFYRYLSSGGSPKIRSHQRAVREAYSPPSPG